MGGGHSQEVVTHGGLTVCVYREVHVKWTIDYTNM